MAKLPSSASAPRSAWAWPTKMIDHAGEGGQRAADRALADRLLEDQRRQHQRDQRGDEGQRDRLRHRHPGQAPEEQDRHRHHHRPAQQVEAERGAAAARGCGWREREWRRAAMPTSERHISVGKVPIASVRPFITMSMIENSAIPSDRGGIGRKGAVRRAHPPRLSERRFVQLYEHHIVAATFRPRPSARKAWPSSDRSEPSRITARTFSTACRRPRRCPAPNPCRGPARRRLRRQLVNSAGLNVKAQPARIVDGQRNTGRSGVDQEMDQVAVVDLAWV